MNDEPKRASQPATPELGAEPAVPQPASQEQLHRVAQAMALAAHGIRAGASDARENAQVVAAGFSRVLSKTVYTTCYYLSYGVVFPTLLVASVLPTDNAIGHGLLDGASAASDMVKQLKAQRAANRAAREEADEAPETGSAAPAFALGFWASGGCQAPVPALL